MTRPTAKSPPEAAQAAPGGLSFVLSDSRWRLRRLTDITCPLGIRKLFFQRRFRTWGSRRLSRVKPPDQNVKIQAPLRPSPPPVHGRLLGSKRPGAIGTKSAFYTSMRARAKRGPKVRPPSAPLPAFHQAGPAPFHATSGQSCPARRFRPQSAPNCTYPGT